MKQRSGGRVCADGGVSGSGGGEGDADAAIPAAVPTPAEPSPGRKWILVEDNGKSFGEKLRMFPSYTFDRRILQKPS